MPADQHFTFAFPAELAARVEQAVPLRQRNALVVNAVLLQLEALERGQLWVEMKECAQEMYDETIRIEAEFHPLEEEIHRALW